MVQCIREHTRRDDAKMMKAVLFDLDGTLLLSDEEEFYSAYYKTLGKYCIDLIEPSKLVESVQKIIKKITMDDGKLNNYDRFVNVMKEELGEKLAKALESRFNAFYSSEEFDGLKSLTVPNEKLIGWMRKTENSKLKKVLATNPIFPKSAILKRMEWAGLSERDFDWISVMENSHFLKPRGEYYVEIAQKLAVKPEECMMIGNDALLDGACSKVGMTFKHIKDFQV